MKERMDYLLTHTQKEFLEKYKFRGMRSLFRGYYVAAFRRTEPMGDVKFDSEIPSDEYFEKLYNEHYADTRLRGPEDVKNFYIVRRLLAYYNTLSDDEMCEYD